MSQIHDTQLQCYPITCQDSGDIFTLLHCHKEPEALEAGLYNTSDKAGVWAPFTATDTPILQPMISQIPRHRPPSDGEI